MSIRLVFRVIRQALGMTAWMLFALAAQAAPPRYHAIALSSGNSQAFGINRLNDVSLWSDDLGGYTGAWVDGTLVLVPLGTASRPSGDGRVGVLVDNGDGRQRPGLFHLRTGVISAVGPAHSLPPVVKDANANGVAVGCVSEAPPNAKVYLGGSETDLGQGCVNAVDRDGGVAGTLWIYDPVLDANVWRAFASGPGLTSIQWILPFPGGVWTEVHDVCDALVAGSSDLAAGSGSQGFVHNLRTGRTLRLAGLGGSWAGALGIRQADQVVGWATLPGDADYRAVLWTGTQQAFDLNALSDVPAGWTLYEAVDINRKGRIVANAIDAVGNVKAFLLKPRSARGALTDTLAYRPAVSLQRLCAAPGPVGMAVAGGRPAACRQGMGSR